MEETRFSHVHLLTEYETYQAQFSNVFMYVEVDVPGPPMFSNVFLYVEFSGDPSGVEAVGVEFADNTTPEGMGDPLFSDRSAWDTTKSPEYHARDISEEEPQYHVVPGDDVGQVPIWDGDKWEPGFQPAGSISVQKDGVGLGVADTFNILSIGASVASGVASIGFAQPLIHYIGRDFPYHGAPATLTPTNHSATAVRVFPFHLPYGGTWANLYLRTNAAVTACLNVGIYSAAGVRLWQSTGLNTVATNYITIAMGGLVLPAGTYFFATGNNNVASTTAAYTVSIAMGTAPPPMFGTIATTLGALPASFTPATDITANTGGYMIFGMMQK
jgi:hypothetical protein